MSAPRKNNGNRNIAIGMAAIAISMVGAAYAAVPLYNLFCRATGYAGTTQRAETGADRILDRTVTVKFDSNVAQNLPWDFKPEQRSVTVKLGETVQIAYMAHNRGTKPLVATSTFNVSPPQAGAYFNKIQCFCFTEQELKPGETISMPVEFFVSPDAVDDEMMDTVNTITLSYTFFPAEEPKTVARAGVADTDESNQKPAL
ncbi:MAG: cytochrome c oxidase assembly protein [Rhodobiaceae bacterium]|nr:cytochrome c oxidase assembly protein [Rhodobiaceae bacterium]